MAKSRTDNTGNLPIDTETESPTKRKIIQDRNDEPNNENSNLEDKFVTSKLESLEVPSDPLTKKTETLYDFNYPMEAKGRGIIIINEHFSPDSGLTERKGAKKDLEYLENIYNKLDIDYTENIHRDIKEHQMFDHIRTFAKAIVKPCSVIFVSISSHERNNGEVMGSEGRGITVGELVEIFQKQPSLLGIPKVFLIQACKGGGYEERHCQTDSTTVISPILGFTTNQSDTLIAYSTSEGSVSYRHKTEGSWFFHELHDCIFKQKYENLHFVEILTVVTATIVEECVINKEDKKLTETPFYASSLRLFLRFKKRQTVKRFSS
ncbi:Caspase-3-like [Oopsacas minuta]|uniref:Caspase-3-like n=1 Tax=Oopsacas minuta TaxID=111878 RepID=A0AAV7K0A7_9METZ|nr:Caspase-3-like [Oopsacas minuta]